MLFGVFETGSKAGRPSLVYCGDDSSSKELAAELIGDVVFESVHAGRLRIAHYTEPFALLAHERKASPELAYPFERFGNEAHHV